MNLSTTITHASEAVPGVTFVVRRLNYLARCERDLGILEDRSRLSEIARSMEMHCEGGDATKPPLAGHEAEHRKLDAEYSLVYQSRIVPAYLRAGLVSLTGVDVDGAPADAAAFAGWAPDALLDEMFGACVAASDLAENERKNSSSPGTSGAPEAGPATSTIVGSAGD